MQMRSSGKNCRRLPARSRSGSCTAETGSPTLRNRAARTILPSLHQSLRHGTTRCRRRSTLHRFLSRSERLCPDWQRVRSSRTACFSIFSEAHAEPRCLLARQPCSATTPELAGGRSPNEGDAERGPTDYARSMSTPWFSVIESLQGGSPPVPKDWSARRVHRIADDALPNTKQVFLIRRPDVRPVAVRPVMRLRCPCTECVAKAGPRESWRPS